MKIDTDKGVEDIVKEIIYSEGLGFQESSAMS